MILKIYSNNFLKTYSTHNALNTFIFVFSDFETLSQDDLVFSRSFLLSSFFNSFRFYFSRGNQLKSFIVKSYHVGLKSGTFVFTRYQSSFIRSRSKTKKTISKKKKLFNILYMINVKAATIRYGLSRFWSSKTSSLSYNTKILSIYVNKLVNEFFTSAEFIKIGVAYDYSILHFYTTSFEISVYLQASLSEEINYFHRSRLTPVFKFLFIGFNHSALKLFYRSFFKRPKPKRKRGMSPQNQMRKLKAAGFFKYTKVAKSKPFRLAFRKISALKDYRLSLRLRLTEFRKFKYFYSKKLFFNRKAKFNSFTAFKVPGRSFRLSSKLFKHFFRKFLIRKKFMNISYFYKKKPAYFLTKFKSFGYMLPNFHKLSSFRPDKPINFVTTFNFNSINDYFVFCNKKRLAKYFFSTLFSRSRRRRRIRYFKRRQANKNFFFSLRHSSFLRFSRFISKLLQSFIFPELKIRKVNVFKLKYSRINVSSFVFYSAVKLYYKYILNDVIRPIIRGASKYYSGFFVLCKGRFTRAQIASKKLFRRNFINYNRMFVPVYYSMRSVALRYGASTVHIWVQHLF
jgi:hypothetical protein